MEKEFCENVLKALSEDFIIFKEVSGKHFSGAQLRIDAVLIPKDTSQWKDKNICLGVEFKCETTDKYKTKVKKGTFVLLDENKDTIKNESFKINREGIL